jgi:two-component system chemotaxis response regulator CheY
MQPIGCISEAAGPGDGAAKRLSGTRFERIIRPVVPTILIADDSPTIRGFLRLALRALGQRFLIEEAEDGEQAIVRARSSPPALALIDLHMPGSGGLEVLRALRQESDQRLRDLPILILSAERGEELRQDCTRAGATGFLDKPIDQARLLEAVRRHLAPGNGP